MRLRQNTRKEIASKLRGVGNVVTIAALVLVAAFLIGCAFGCGLKFVGACQCEASK